MAKIVKSTHVLGERGVNVFADYCNRHKPYIIWREEAKNDFGVDGEVELCTINDKGQIVASGYILKVQIKSTEGGYIESEDDESITYRASKDDIHYWQDHNLDVILIIFYASGNGEERLFAKKITGLDLSQSQKSIAISFSKKDHVLELGETLFKDKFAKNFKPRVREAISEQLVTNIFPFTHLPKYIYAYRTNIKSPLDVFENLEQETYPIFYLHSDLIYTFSDIQPYRDFKEFAVADENAVLQEPYMAFLHNRETRRIGIALLNLHIKDYLYDLGISYNKDYRRYVFAPCRKFYKVDKSSIRKTVRGKWTSQWRLKGKATTLKGRKMPKAVITYYEGYGTLPVFYRHIAFRLQYKLTVEQLLLVITPQYLFTSDGKNPLDDPDLITKLTNALTKDERNIQLIDKVHFLWYFLKNRKFCIRVSDIKGSLIHIGEYLQFDVNFGIHIDQTRSQLSDPNKGATLFDKE